MTADDSLAGYDAAVVGAGPAGLAAALTLSRALRRCIVFDPEEGYRNRDSPGVGALLGRDGLPPAALRGLGRQEIEAYGFARFERQRVRGLAGSRAAGFTLTTADGGGVRARLVLLACGMVDLFPDLGNLGSFWGGSVINCPFCHGFELRGRPWGVYVHRPEMLEAAEIYRTWTDDLIFFLEPGQEPDEARARALEAQGFRLERRRVRRLLGGETGLEALALEDGSRVAREALVLWPRQRHCALVEALDLPRDEAGCLVVDAGFRTPRAGLYAAGDLLYQGHQNVSTALHMGNLAAAAMVMDLAQGGP